MENEGLRISRAEFERNFLAKIANTNFTKDVVPLLIAGTVFDFPVAAKYLMNQLLPFIPGEPWQGNAS